MGRKFPLLSHIRRRLSNTYIYHPPGEQQRCSEGHCFVGGAAIALGSRPCVKWEILAFLRVFHALCTRLQFLSTRKLIASRFWGLTNAVWCTQYLDTRFIRWDLRIKALGHAFGRVGSTRHATSRQCQPLGSIICKLQHMLVQVGSTRWRSFRRFSRVGDTGSRYSADYLTEAAMGYKLYVRRLARIKSWTTARLRGVRGSRNVQIRTRRVGSGCSF